MKKATWLLCIGVVIGLVVGFGIGRHPEPATGAKQPVMGTDVPKWLNESKTVGYVQPNDGPYYNLKWEGVSSRLQTLGYEPQKYSAGGYKNVKAQIDIVDSLIQKKAAGIILHAVDEKALIPSVERAYLAGIPVVCENVEVRSDKVMGSVQLANEENGWELAMALADGIGGKGKIVALVGPPGLEVTDTMWRSAKDYLARFPGIEVVREEYLAVNAPDALKVMEAILVAHKDLAGVYAWYVDNAIGAVQALKNAGYKPGQLKVVCKDINPQGESLMREGYIQGFLVGEPILMGETSAQLVDAIRSGKQLPGKVTLRNRLVTTNTIDQIDRSKFEAKK